MTDGHGDRERTELRKRIIAARDALSTEQLTAGASGLCSLLASTPEYRRATRVAAYWPINGEADVHPLLEQARSDGKEIFLPIVGDDGLLRFAPFTPDRPMRPNRLRIPEPDVPAEAYLDAHRMELVVVPLTVFDDRGNRLGMGGGFYDRTFAFLRDAPRPEWPVLVGAAHELQRTDALPACPWDVPLDFVVTESRVWRPARKAAAGARAG